jgi:TPP-dependent pyruvate/acetoin dehydrogenase alpha subunit
MDSSEQGSSALSVRPVPTGQEGVAPDEWALYSMIYTIRIVEESLLRLFSKGVLFGTVHTCIGQEGSVVGVVTALDKSRDVVWSSHRGHGHYLAFTDDVQGLMAEVMGKRSGVNSGIGGSQHLHRDRLFTNGVLGGIAPCAVGTAFAEKYGGTGGIVSVFLGDGAFGEGVVYESLNIASLWSLPVLFVLDDNGYAQSTPKRYEHAGDLRTRAATFGIQSAHVAASDVLAVREAAMEAVRLVRTQSRPFFLSVETFRLAPHSKGDDTRSEEELRVLRLRDPLVKLRSVLEGYAPERLTSLESDVRIRVEECIRRAEEDAPLPASEFLERASRW